MFSDHIRFITLEPNTDYFVAVETINSNGFFLKFNGFGGSRRLQIQAQKSKWKETNLTTSDEQQEIGEDREDENNRKSGTNTFLNRGIEKTEKPKTKLK
ncbi:hypothetical protein LXL04_019260 [Taraxacum kok-saghyz]